MAKKRNSKRKTASKQVVYSKKLLTPRNLLLYFLVGGVVYFLTYKLFSTRNNFLSYNQEVKTVSKQTVITLSPENKSGESGVATLTEESGKLKVSINLVNFPKNVPQPVHIHVGSCPGVGAVKYPLTNVLNGNSETVLDTTLEQIKTALPLAINVHKSTTLTKTYVSCGRL